MREVAENATVADVAAAIGRRLAKDALGGKVNGKAVDVYAPVPEGAKVEIITPKSEAGLDTIRHSTAHLMAMAVQELFPGTQVTIGPVIENGFFYDFATDRAFLEEDLRRIEEKMQEIVKRDLPIRREELSRDEAIALFDRIGEKYKVEIISAIPGDETLSMYRQGEWFDLCRGPHVPSTGRLGAFKLMSVAGAYWRGDNTKAMLQRIYGTAWADKEQLEAHLKQLEEAKARDHRKLGKELDLFSIQELAGPGLIFFHPKGGTVRKLLEDWMRTEYVARGYSLVYTPHVARRELYKVSGHANFYSDNMFTPMELDDAEYQLKPMNCPCHILIYADKPHSYRDLPVRLGELGTVYRYERSGVMHGLMRVRGFTQDDAHIFCTPEQIEDEVVGCLQFAVDTLTTFGFESYEAELSTWDGGASGKYDGSPEQWKLGEDALMKATTRLNLKVKVIPDEAAFYGPKIDMKLVDAIGRLWQLSTVQFDFTLPRRFGLEFIAEDGKKHQPLMVHRALFGSVERFFGILIEHYAGAFPVWLAPVQAVVLPITDRQLEYSRGVRDRLVAAGIRATVDERNEKVNLKIRDAQLQKVPFMLVVGDREQQSGQVAVRNRKHGDQGVKTVDEFLSDISKLIAAKTPFE